MSPNDWFSNNNHSRMFCVLGSSGSGILRDDHVGVADGVRPVISLENGNFIVIL